jgi:NADPH2 dehydrogenase
MASSTADEQGYVTGKTLYHYQRLARAGAGLVFAEYSHVHGSGRSEPNQLGIDHDDKIPGLSQIARIIHRSGALAGMQITHAGGKSEKQYTGGPLLGPSNLRVPVAKGHLEPMTSLSLAEIEDYKTWFVEAASRASRAGFDIVELHTAHGYGLNQWLSPLTNRRDDQYGGPLINRMRILEEIILGIKANNPELIISLRFPGQDLLPEGMSQSEAQWIARRLEYAGVGLFNVSNGLGGWRRPRDRRGQGYLVDEAQAISRVVQVPVIGVGGIKDGAFIDEGLRQRKFDLAAVGRAILEDPDGFRQLQMSL